MPAVKARWMAVQAEPITFSGERITIAVAIVMEDGGYQVVRAIDLEPLECAFGRFGAQFLALADQVVANLQGHLATGGRLEEWRPIFEGIYTGQAVTTHNTSVEKITASALRHTSLFSAKTRNRRENQPGQRQLVRFQKQIKDIVTATREGYGPRFNRGMSVFKNTKTQYSYIGDHLAMNLAIMDATGTGHSQQRDAAIRKLNQLAALRDHAPQFSHQLKSLVMGIWVPSHQLDERQQDLLDSYLDELAVDAKRLEVRFEPTDGRRAMADAAQPFARMILADV
ncbi:hypothetical protein [Halomonas borealis]|uniref:hypothetical protein n=1 Tax=Halomonas borealis TaxID=2508710 RepID=UPI00109F10AA|nr:hypothetical protein [Halomonas borealis]